MTSTIQHERRSARARLRRGLRAGTVMAAGMCAAAVTCLVAAEPAAASPASLNINSARAEGGTANAFVNVTYTCAAGEASELRVQLVLFKGVAVGRLTPTCNGEAQTTDVKVFDLLPIVPGDTALATAQLVGPAPWRIPVASDVDVVVLT